MSDRDAAEVAAESGGAADRLAPGGGSPAQGTVDGADTVDALDGVLSPGSTATDAPTDPAG